MPNRSWTVGEIRLIMPLKTVCQRYSEIECHFVAVFDITSEDLENTNIVILQRIASPFVEKLAKKLLAMQVPYIYEIDDLLWDMPRELLSSSAWSRNKKRLFFLLENASAVTTSTQNIADKLHKSNKNVYVIPNVLFQEAKKNICFNTNAKLILSATDRMYINTVSSALKILQDTYSTEIIALGPVAHDLRKKGVQVNEFPVMSLEEYSAWLNSLDNVIALCPLDASNFSKCKSAIKYHSYSLAGIPVLASNLEPYSNVIEHQHNGYLISQDTSQAWMDAILLHLRNPDLLEKYVKNASVYFQKSPDPAAAWYDLLIRLYHDSKKSIHNFEVPSSWDWGYLRYFFSFEKYIAFSRLIKQYGLKKIFLLLRKGM